MVTIEKARNAALAYEFHADIIDRMHDAGIRQVTLREFVAEQELMKFFRKLAFRVSQMLDPSERDLLRLERQNRAVKKFREARGMSTA